MHKRLKLKNKSHDKFFRTFQSHTATRGKKLLIQNQELPM